MAAADSANAARLGLTVAKPSSIMPEDSSLISAKQAAQDTYYTKKVGTTGKTAAQLDAAMNAQKTATQIGGTVDPTTGKVVAPKKKVDGTTDINATGIDPTLVPGSTGGTTDAPERTLSRDTFRNTLALLLGPLEASQPWVSEMFGLVSGFYKSGSSIEDSLNLGLYDAKAKGLAPQFTKRFDGVFKLQARLQAGEAISVPTIAEFIKAESDMGDILREVGMPELANQEFLGSVIGLGKSVLEVGKLISDTFATIDNAPKALKDTLSTYFPTVDRVSLAKALLTGKEGAVELDKKIKGITVLSAAGTQGVNLDLAAAGDIAAMGYGYNESLQGFGSVKQLERANTLAQFEGKGFTQQESIDMTFGQSASAIEKARLLKEKESARFSGQSGLAASALRGKSAKTAI